MATLYISYDGLTDPLGASQIIPYIKGISKHQDKVFVLSFEKFKKNEYNCKMVRRDIGLCEIKWISLQFTGGFGLIGKAWDLSKMYTMALFLAYKYKVEIVHARGHLSAQTAYLVKRLLGAKLLFDFRGFWADERVDKGGWNLDHVFHRIQYNYFKRLEKHILSNTDHVIVLTERSVNEIIKLGIEDASMITVIPCCADFNHFTLPNNNLKIKYKNLLNIPKDSFVIGYLGSVGSMYLIDRVLHFFNIVTKVRSDCHILFITNNALELRSLIVDRLPKKIHNLIHIKSANRKEVPLFLSTIDIMVSFILPSYARIATSPTKIAECFATGIPVLSNDGIGDVTKIIDSINGGKIINPFFDKELMIAATELNSISKHGGDNLRNKALPILGLELANARYKSAYKQILKGVIR